MLMFASGNNDDDCSTDDDSDDCNEGKVNPSEI